MLRWLLILMLTGALGVTAATAEDVTERLGLGFEGGIMKLTGGDHDYSNMDQHIGFRIRHGLAPHWSLEIALKYGWVRPGVANPGEDAGYDFGTGAGLYTVIWQPRAGFLYHFSPQRSFSPYLGLSVGATAWRVHDQRADFDVGLNPDGPIPFGYDEDGASQQLKMTNLTTTVSGGLELFLSSSLAVDLGARYSLLLGNDRDNVGMSTFWGPENVDANTGLLEAFVGFTAFFGSVDKDGDGLRNDDDACPEDPEDFDGFQDADGCPEPDNDGDGILDAADACPDEAEDRDGYQDDDGCPEPDNDGDGILDAADACPDEAEDLDGFEDQDGCPEADNDGDGVLDADDQCANTPAGVEVDETGCPVVEEIKEALVLEGVTFRSGSAELTPESLAVLDKVAESLIAWPDVIIEIRGHTDSSGPAELNRRLSQTRAEAVMQYLIGKGVAGSRMTAIGYGEDFQIAPNDTAEGRAKNRRVELHRVNY